MFLSVIIPCYRETKEQLNRCLNSLGFLTSICEWEAWIVDDGSPNHQAQAWVAERNDEHLHCICQTNQGQSVARNNALEKAEGEYIALLDADDEWIPEEYVKLIQILQEQHPDLLGLRWKQTTVPYYDGSAIQFIQEEDINPAAWGYIYRKKAIGDLRYTPGIFHEDEEFNTLLHLRTERLIMTPIAAYHYHTNPESTVRTLNKQRLEKRFNDFLGVVGRMQAESTLHQELQRRVHVMAMCFIADLLQSAPSRTFLFDKLNDLKKLKLYPLPPYKGIKRYGWIRPLTFLKSLCYLENRIIRTFRSIRN